MLWILNRRNHISRLAKIKFVDPDVKPNTTLAHSIPLFESGQFQDEDKTAIDNEFNNIYTKSALWAAMSFLWNSDLGENGVKFYFHVESTLEGIVVPYLREHGVPSEYIRVITLPERYSYNRDMNHTQLGKKFMAFYDEEFPADLINFTDSDMFLCAKTRKQALYRDLSSPLARRNIAAWYCYFQRCNYRSKLSANCNGAGVSIQELHKHGYIKEGEDFSKSVNILNADGIESLCYAKYNLPYWVNENVQPSDYVVRPSTAGQMYQMPFTHSFAEFYRKFGHHCYQDEELFGMYCMANGVPPLALSELLGVRLFFWKHQYDPSEEVYFAHYLDAEDEPEGEAYTDLYLSLMNIFHNIAT